MRILVLDTTVCGELIGGAQTFLVGFLGGLVRGGHEVHLVAGGEPNERLRSAIKATGAKIHSDFSSDSEIMDNVAERAAGWVNEINPDVYVVSVSPDIGWVVLPHLDPRIATVAIGHNDEETFYAPVRHYGRFLTRAVGVSDAICRKYVEECGMPRERVDWIPYGVETLTEEPKEFGDGPLRLVYVGRVENVQKRIRDVVAVIKKLSEDGADFTFDLIGDGEEMSYVRDSLADRIDAGQVRLHGWLSSDQVIGKLRESEALILASAYEGFCISLTEALANGCTPVVTDIESGNKQLVEDGVNGFVVPVGDVTAFVDRIKFLANDRERLMEMRQSAWYTGKQYSIDRMVDNYVSCFERAVDDALLNPRTPDPNFPLMESCRSKYPLWLRRLKARAKRLAAG